LAADAISIFATATNCCLLLLLPQPLPLFLPLFSLVMFKILPRPSNILNIFAVTFWLIVVCPCAASYFATVAYLGHCAFTNLLVVVVTCAANTAGCLSLTMVGGGAATPAPNAPDKHVNNEEYYCRRAAVA
jgi:hypothetical protein